jgi:hypothetical protein
MYVTERRWWSRGRIVRKRSSISKNPKMEETDSDSDTDTEINPQLLMVRMAAAITSFEHRAARIQTRLPA